MQQGEIRGRFVGVCIVERVVGEYVNSVRGIVEALKQKIRMATPRSVEFPFSVMKAGASSLSTSPVTRNMLVVNAN